MTKRRRKNTKHSIPSENTVNIFLPDYLDSIDIQHIIAQALVESEDIKRQKEEQRREAELKNWHTIIGYKDYSESRWYIRVPLRFFNDINLFLKLLFLPKRKIEGDYAISALLKTFLSMFFNLVGKVLFLLALSLVGIVLFQSKIFDVQVPWYMNLFIGVLAFLIYTFSRIFRMASIEIEKMEDRSYLVGILASVTSIVSISIAIFAVVRGG